MLRESSDFVFDCYYHVKSVNVVHAYLYQTKMQSLGWASQIKMPSLGWASQIKTPSLGWLSISYSVFGGYTQACNKVLRQSYYIVDLSTISRVSNQNSISQLFIIVEIYHSGRKPLIYTAINTSTYKNIHWDGTYVCHDNFGLEFSTYQG